MRKTLIFVMALCMVGALSGTVLAGGGLGECGAWHAAQASKDKANTAEPVAAAAPAKANADKVLLADNTQPAKAVEVKK